MAPSHNAGDCLILLRKSASIRFHEHTGKMPHRASDWQRTRTYSKSAIIQRFAHKSSFFMPLGVRRLTKRILFLVLGVWSGIGLVSCGGYSSYGSKKPPSGINTRVLASQSVTSAGDFGGLSLINGIYDTIVRPTGMTAGSE